MTGKQASKLRPGARIRRKDSAEDGRVFVVERVEPAAKGGDTATVYASGRIFKAWEIERADRRPS